MANLTFGANRLTFGGNVLVFGTGAVSPRGDDAFRSSGARERFWRKKAEDWLDEQLENVKRDERRSPTARKRVVRRFRANLDEYESVVAMPLISDILRQMARPQPDYTALAMMIIAAQDAMARERIMQRRKRDIETLLVLM